MSVIVIVVGFDLNSTGRRVFCVAVRNEEVRVNPAELTIMPVAGVDVLKRRKQESQQECQAGFYGDRPAHSMKSLQKSIPPPRFGRSRPTPLGQSR
jgi:hypothetical protein